MEQLKGKAYTPERLMQVRRMREARRLFKQSPLFAYELMLQKYPAYTHYQFLDDLRRRTKKRPGRKKTTLTKYGRFARMQKMLGEYSQTKDIKPLLAATKLRERMTKPYRVVATVGKQRMEFCFPPTVQIQAIEQLTTDLSKCASMEEVSIAVSRFQLYT